MDDRAEWERYADRLLDAVVPYATPGFAQFRLPGRTGRSGERSDGLEGFARTFMLAAFRIAGAGGDAPGLIERYAAGLASGTDPASRYAWPEITDIKQQMVEAAAIAIALHESRPWLWDRLEPAVQSRVLSWLEGFTGKRTPANNWVLFRAVTEQFVLSAGGRASADEIEADLEHVDNLYVGDGWYTDGPGQNFDYYIGWAMHLYPLLWTRIAAAGIPVAVPVFLRHRRGAGVPGTVADLPVRVRGAAVARRAVRRDAPDARADPPAGVPGAEELRGPWRARFAWTADARLVRRVPAGDAAVLRSRIAVLGEQGVHGPAAARRSPSLDRPGRTIAW